MRMLARVEGMPLAALARRACRGTGRRPASTSTASTARSPSNAGFLVGHSTIRRVVMGERGDAGRGHARRRSTRCDALLHASLAAGALGFSSSWAEHPQRRRRRTGAVAAHDRDELLALCRRDRRASRARHSSSSPTTRGFTERHLDVMADMSAAAPPAAQLEPVDGAAR